MLLTLEDEHHKVRDGYSAIILKSNLKLEGFLLFLLLRKGPFRDKRGGRACLSSFITSYFSLFFCCSRAVMTKVPSLDPVVTGVCCCTFSDRPGLLPLLLVLLYSTITHVGCVVRAESMIFFQEVSFLFLLCRRIFVEVAAGRRSFCPSVRLSG